MLLLANSGRTSYAWTDADMRRSAVPLEDAMFNTVADEIDGFDLGTNAGCASYRPRAALLPVCYQLAALWQPSPTCWMSPLGEWSNDRGLCEPLSHRMRRSPWSVSHICRRGSVSTRYRGACSLLLKSV